ncbi:MAG: VOC family protein, partial [Acidimicrobiales bacterium]|nr:VOC family protein [Acidimicrobiales bacterium]
LQVGIVPVDLDRSLAFYRNVIGLRYLGPRPVIEGRTLHMFEVGEGVFKLFEAPAGSAPPSASAPPGPFQAATGIRWLTIDTGDTDTDLDEIARRAGADVRWQLPVTEIRAGLRVAILEDPDGNAVELVERG